ncbi:MAG: PAS domain S-box protein [Syntrophales bacterium]|jgi:PAS domain S-box-containing protein|nr:PAS domain S-box protein [Syntrophales bacterium]MDY0045355.1 PAS domain S-box protein [Syntrophales bacterium]
MVSKREKNFIRQAADIFLKAAEGDYSAKITATPSNGVFDSFAHAANLFLRETEQKISSLTRLVEDITRQAAHYRKIINTIEETYFEVDLRGRILFFNGTAIRDLGYTEEELKGLHFLRLMDKANARKVYCAFHHVFVTGQPNKGFEWKILKKNRDLLDVESSISLVKDETGKSTGFKGVVRDITMRKNTERALHEKEEKYRTIFENMEDLYVETDLKGNYTDFNESWRRKLNYTRGELMGMNYRRVTPPEQVNSTFREFNEIFKTGREKIFPEYMLLTKDGSVFYLDMSVSLLRAPTGEPIGFYGLGRDITERVKARQKLEASEKHLRLINENINDIIWTMDSDLNFTYFSPSVLPITGYSPDELKKIPLQEMVSQQTYARIKEILKNEMDNEKERISPDKSEPVTIEMALKRKDGSRMFTEVNVSFNRDEKGGPFAIVGITRDISERKRFERKLRESEKRYRMIVENMTDMIATMDMDFRYTYQSPSIKRITGYSLDELADIPISKRITPDSMFKVEQLLSCALNYEARYGRTEGNKPQIIEVEAYHKHGGTVWMEVITTFTRDQEGKPTGILYSGRDVTERKRAAEEKGKLESQLMQAQKMETLGRLAGGVAHDFNNMLSVILGYVDLAKMRLAKEHPVLTDLVEIEKAAVRSRDITGQLLAFSRKQIIAPKIINLNELVVNTQKLLIRLIGEHIDLKIQLENSLWKIKYDPSQIEQILINLAVNARDAMHEGGKLKIETKNTILDEFYCRNHVGVLPGEYVQLTVSDSGIGMDKETMHHIFEPFYTTKKAGRGTGLGMATVYGIIKQNNGAISVYSEPGLGTRFHIYIPRTAEKEKPAAESSQAPVFKVGGNILLVEDDPMVLDITREMLESIGYNVIIAETPRDAISYCKAEGSRITLIITDIVMPEMNGRELIHILKEFKPDIKVLYMSGYTADMIDHHGILNEGIHFLQKPFRLKDLVCKIKEAVEA